MSATTFGRASKFAPITPTGLRRSSAIRSPGSSRITRRSGSGGTSARARSCPDIALSRLSSRRSRSISAPVRPPASAARISSSFAARIAPAARSSRSAMARSAKPIASSGAIARHPAARCAARAAAWTASVAPGSPTLALCPAATCIEAFSPVIVIPSPLSLPSSQPQALSNTRAYPAAPARRLGHGSVMAICGGPLPSEQARHVDRLMERGGDAI
jgi:hypothetical protein